MLFGCSEDFVDSDEYANWPKYGDVIVRDTWNIELEFIKTTESSIVIEIRDLDNKGFYMNDFYFVLERLENGEWVKIVTPDPGEAHESLRLFCLPDTKADFSVSWSVNMYKLREQGHYRITKVLKKNTSPYSGEVFCTEFDIE